MQSVVRSFLGVLLLTVVFGFVFPTVMYGVAAVAFGDKSRGSLVDVDGRAVGSKLAAQAFTKPEYFHPRPSAVDYNAAGTSFSNLGPTNPELRKAVQAQIDAVLALEGPFNPGLAVSDIPVDAVTTSGSGIDPHISVAYARLQAARVAQERGLSPERVGDLIDEHTDGRFLGFIGDPGVNVLELNIALDQETR